MSLSKEERAKLNELVIDALEDADPKKRRVAAEAQLISRLTHSFHRLNEKTEIDLDYVTCAEYQLFLDELRVEDKFYQPDHWTSYQFPAGQAQTPASGIRPEDAQAFCRWLTLHENRGKRYRLPIPEEINQFPLPEKTLGAWCRDVGIFSLNGLENNEKIRRELKLLLKESDSMLTSLDFNTNLEVESDNIFSRFIQLLPFLLNSIFIWILVIGLLVLVLCFIYLTAPFSLGIIALIVFGFWLIDLFLNIKNWKISDLLAGFMSITVATIVVLGVLSLMFYFYPILFSSLIVFAMVCFALKERIEGAASKIIAKLSRYGNRLSTYLVDLGLYSKKEFSNIYNKYTLADLNNRKLPSDIGDRLSHRKFALQHYENYLFNIKNFWHRRGEKTKNQKILKEFYCLQIVVAREEGKLPAWEGIRLVRDISQ